MKTFLLIALFLLVVILVSNAQTFSEWFRQRKTQIKYLEKQIAALQVYKGLVEKGYKVVKDGTDVIGWIRQGDLDLHGEHFRSLLTVKASIRNDPTVQSARTLIVMMNEREEEQCLDQLLEDGYYQLSDRDRMHLIELCYERLRAKWKVINPMP